MDKHAGKWDTFSLFLINNVEHLRELESLIVRVAEPKGNAQRGKFAKSANLLKMLKARMEDHDRRRRDAILRRLPSRQGERVPARKRVKGDHGLLLPSLISVLPKGSRLRGVYKGKEIFATIDKAGRILLNGSIYDSPSGAGAKAREGKATNGWLFWKYRDPSNQWKKLDDLRKKG